MSAVFLTLMLFSPYLRIIRSETYISLRRIFVILDFLSLCHLPNESCFQISDVLSTLLFCCFLCLSVPPPPSDFTLSLIGLSPFVTFVLLSTKATTRIHEYTYWKYIKPHLMNVYRGSLFVDKTNEVAQPSQQLTADYVNPNHVSGWDLIPTWCTVFFSVTPPPDHPYSWATSLSVACHAEVRDWPSV